MRSWQAILGTREQDQPFGDLGFFQSDASSIGSDNTINITLQNQKILTLKQGDFEGDMELARRAIQRFAEQEELTIGHRGGKKILYVNGLSREIPASGLEVAQVLTQCHIDFSQLFSSKFK